MAFPILPLRTRILLVVLAVAVIPMGLLGIWLTRSAVQSSRSLVATRVATSLEETAERVGNRWIRVRSRLLDFADAPAVQDLLATGRRDTAALRAAFDLLGPEILGVRLAAPDGTERWAVRRTESEEGLDAALPTLTIPLAVYGRGLGARLGTLDASLGVAALLPPEGIAPAAPGLVLGVFETATGASLRPLPFDPALLTTPRFTWGGDDWLATTRTIVEPPITLAAAAPLSAFTAPFEQAARQGTWLLLLVAVVGFSLVTALTTRFTRSLGTVSRAADAIAAGDLDQRVDDVGPDEVGRLAQAFNTMTASLRHTLNELAKRESLAAVGEFAASLAHEVRNPLTAIRVDLQRVEEGLAPDSPLRPAQARALREISRLDETVGKALVKARRGDAGMASIDLREAVTAAAAAARPAFGDAQAGLELRLPDRPVTLRGDLAALEQLFLNLLQNAAQALSPGGRALVALEDGRQVVATVRDDGHGVPAEALPHLFEPLFTTRPEGTGLGLAISRRIASAHGAEIRFQSTQDEGTTVRVVFDRPGNGSG